MKMEPIVSSETSAIKSQTPGNYPKRNKLHILYSSICFEHYVLIIRRSKLYYTASGTITSVGGCPVHRLREAGQLLRLYWDARAAKHKKKMLLCMSYYAKQKNTYRMENQFVESSWNVIAQADAREGKWRGNWRMEWVASTLHTTSEHGVSSITTADAHTSAASSRLNWRPRRFKWTRPFRRKTKPITFQTQSKSECMMLLPKCRANEVVITECNCIWTFTLKMRVETQGGLHTGCPVFLP